MRHGRLAVVSLLGGAVSILPFAQEWFRVGDAAASWALFGALVCTVALGFALALSPPLNRLVAFLAGPPEPRARALVLVAVFAGVGALGMTLALWLSSR